MVCWNTWCQIDAWLGVHTDVPRQEARTTSQSSTYSSACLLTSYTFVFTWAQQFDQTHGSATETGPRRTAPNNDGGAAGPSRTTPNNDCASVTALRRRRRRRRRRAIGSAAVTTCSTAAAAAPEAAIELPGAVSLCVEHGFTHELFVDVGNPIRFHTCGTACSCKSHASHGTLIFLERLHA